MKGQPQILVEQLQDGKEKEGMDTFVTLVLFCKNIIKNILFTVRRLLI
jgi:hypothetical protein